MLGKKEINSTLRLLLATTEKLIKKKGCSQITMQDIIEHSGISKGGIYHYVESKDELFSMVLQTHLERIRTQFLELLEREDLEEKDWFEVLINRFYRFDEDSISSHILLYLLSKRDDLSVRQAIRSYYRQVVQTTLIWIEAGQKAGCFSTIVDAKKMADLFVLISLGFHIRSVIPSETGYFTNVDFFKLMRGILQNA